MFIQVRENVIGPSLVHFYIVGIKFESNHSQYLTFWAQHLYARCNSLHTTTAWKYSLCFAILLNPLGIRNCFRYIHSYFLWILHATVYSTTHKSKSVFPIKNMPYEWRQGEPILRYAPIHVYACIWNLYIYIIFVTVQSIVC